MNLKFRPTVLTCSLWVRWWCME